jgi:ATP dependent DNA ligase C terminal region
MRPVYAEIKISRVARRVNQAQGFVIGGYTPAGRNFDAIIFGYYDGEGRLVYAARTRNGFTPVSRDELFRRFLGLETAECPFVNLPEARSGRWGQGLTAEKVKECRWLRPELVGQFEFVEWTPDGHLRHARFVGIREDKKAWEVRRIWHGQWRLGIERLQSGLSGDQARILALPKPAGYDSWQARVRCMAYLRVTYTYAREDFVGNGQSKIVDADRSNSRSVCGARAVVKSSHSRDSSNARWQSEPFRAGAARCPWTPRPLRAVANGERAA